MRLPFMRPRPVLAGESVLLPRGAGPAQLPAECACCAGPATHQLGLSGKDGASVLVGYCEECAEHQAAVSSRVLAVALASLILALAAAAGLPLLAPGLGLFAFVMSVAGLSILPLAALLYRPAATELPHTARGPAVQWAGVDRLWCAAPRYAARLAELNAGKLSAEPVQERLGSAWLSAGPVLGVGAACLSFFVYHPLLRVLNLGTTRIEVAIDGHRLVAVDPTSNESPAAGALVRVPAGEHVLGVSSTVDGSALGRIQADFHSGAVHLFAYGADDTCFWLETTGYGQERLAERSYEPLRSAEHFWVLPGGIDTWFAANPIASDPSSHSSGGLLDRASTGPVCGSAAGSPRRTVKLPHCLHLCRFRSSGASLSDYTPRAVSEENPMSEAPPQEPSTEETAAAAEVDPLEASKAEVAKLRDQLLRTAADFDNFRKRSRRELADMEKRAREDLIKDLLPVFDNLERATAHAETATDVKALADGIGLVKRQFLDTLSKIGIERIKTQGEPFDPAFHEAVQQFETADHPPGTVIHEVQAGYVQGDKLVRPAIVVVAKAKAN